MTNSTRTAIIASSFLSFFLFRSSLAAWLIVAVTVPICLTVAALTRELRTVKTA